MSRKKNVLVFMPCRASKGQKERLLGKMGGGQKRNEKGGGERERRKKGSRYTHLTHSAVGVEKQHLKKGDGQGKT